MEKKCKAQIAVRLPRELQEAYRTEAKQQRRKPSELIRIALEAYAQSFESKQETMAA
jgi:predicted DNA-binding protein